MSEKPVKELLKQKKIHEVINIRLVQGESSMSINDAVRKMRENGSGYIVISNNKKVVGIFTEVDIIFKIIGKDVDWTRPVSDFMTKDPYVLTPDDSVGEAIDLMGKHRFYHIPLVDKNKELTGVISVRSLIRFLSEFYPTEVYNLPPEIDKIVESAEGG